MKVLAGVLHHGENEFEQSLRSLKQQEGIELDFFMVGNKTNKEAHNFVYAEFMRRADECDLFLKFDADMVFRGPKELLRIIELKHFSPYLTINVWDWPSQLSIPGLHLYSSGVKWVLGNDPLHVDRHTILLPDGELKVVTDTTALDHMPDPGLFQSFRYGLHKAFKALQPDRAERNLLKGVLHASILAGIARQWRETRDDRRALMLAGATLVFQGQADHLVHDYAGDRAYELYRLVAIDRKWLADLGRSWENETGFFIRWASAFEKQFEARAAA